MIPINITPELWLASKPIHAFHIVVSFVSLGCEDLTSSITLSFLKENLSEKKVHHK